MASVDTICEAIEQRLELNNALEVKTKENEEQRRAQALASD